MSAGNNGSLVALPRAVVEQALEAFNVATTPLARDRQEVLKAMEALRAALEQPQGEQEPVAVASMPFCHLEWLIGETVTAEQVFEMSRQGVKLYTRPQPRKPLTVEQIDGIIRDLDPSWLDTPTGFEEEFCRAIERAHEIGGEK